MHRGDALKLVIDLQSEFFVGGRGHHSALTVHEECDGVVADAGAADELGQPDQAHVDSHHAEQGFAVFGIDGLGQGQVELVFDGRTVDVGEGAFAGGGGQLVPRAFAGVVDRGFGFEQMAAIAGAADEMVGTPRLARTDLPHDEALLFAFHA